MKLTMDEVMLRLYNMEQKFCIQGHFTSERIRLYGIPRGGTIIAGLLQAGSGDTKFFLLRNYVLVDNPHDADIIVDDILDSGATKRGVLDQLEPPEDGAVKPFYVLVDKQQEEIEEWVQFPWEAGVDETITDPVVCVSRLLELLELGINREGRKNTPRRFVDALRELTAGEKQSAEQVLQSASFIQGTNEMIVLRNAPFVSLCEHHLLPFTGLAHIAYLPGASGRVVGLSKLARALDIVSHRLQLQERIAWDLAAIIFQSLGAIGVGVVLQGQHTCMQCRGVKKQGEMVTSCLLGKFREDAQVRHEFLHLIGM